MPQPTEAHEPDRRRFAIAISSGALVVLLIGLALLHHAESRENHTPLPSARPVSVVAASSGQFRDTRTYVGAVASWQEASVGPQYIAAYVTTVAVRPGAVVKRGDVLATLDCAHPTAASREAVAASRAVAERQRATADEATRERTLLDGGYIAQNDVEQKVAQSTAEAAQVTQTQAQLQSAASDVQDCTLRAPFDGEIAARDVDPGAFVTPGTHIVTVVDRSTVRIVVDAPEKDFDALGPGSHARVDLLAIGATLDATIARRAPRADPKTRTVHFELDVPDPDRKFPTDTTAVVHIGVGASRPATAIPLYAAVEQAGKAAVFVVDGGVVHVRRIPVLGEIDGELYFDPKALPAGTRVVTEGRALLSDGDRVDAKPDSAPPAGSGFGSPM
ncbi:MAG TPA: efflux RND transporter periplasmic adaptor subunit [Kofleriaceae bacterium]|jgi:RND family efflux transporter MFP subunit